MDVRLHIQNSAGSQTVTLFDELTVGRTDASGLVLDDPGLSRKNTTFFIDGEDVLVVDEGSTNGTFLNGGKVAGPPVIVRNGDVVKLGSNTTIRVEMIGSGAFGYDPYASAETPAAATPEPEKPVETPVPAPAVKAPAKTSAGERTSPILIAASLLMTFAFLMVGVVFYLYLAADSGANGQFKPPSSSASLIPVRVIDPLGEDEEALDDLIASWEMAEKELDPSDVVGLNVMTDDEQIAALNVSAEFLKERQLEAYAPRNGPVGISHPTMRVPAELVGGRIPKQKAKLAEMKARGYQQPLDFADLAEKRMSGDLIEMPLATMTYYLDVGGSAQSSPFESFAFGVPAQPILPGTEKYNTLSRLASNFAGETYDLNSPDDRKQMRRRLLRMFNKRAKPVLERLAAEYRGRFNRPLRVTSLTRSMDYQILLNQGNANSYRVTSASALPPHTSGCAFDLARKHMTFEEQNFIMEVLAGMEREGLVDALIEGGANACFHVFVYDDGRPPA